ncbi:hypothetical protein OMK64_01820 [Cellulomonas fimi]|uniref:AbiTii domain-containing protein n=1 Tax=Cellulomonas fimi TaxID=1708 RepID=UPI00234CCA06|nr:hypothetical protein [Cellulomonas fimi]MDC7120270.1 hypothetical protein [Cellulomonas fimi]
MTSTRREAALALADELMTDLELSRVPAPALVRKVSRLARLLDDVEAMEWLSHELSGFLAEDGTLQGAAAVAARRSKRGFFHAESGTTRYYASPIGTLQANVDAARARIAAAGDAPVSVTSANPNQFVAAPSGNSRERGSSMEVIARDQALIETILGAVHGYVAEKEVELRFGAAVETAFESVRAVVDSKIAELVPGAAVKLSAAFENAASTNAENWAAAASTCRRLVKDLADALRPVGPPVNGRAMGPENYINRLVDWIVGTGAAGGTAKDVVERDLEYLGMRLDAIVDAGNKGAHADVTRYEASRYITGTYLLLGDLLQMMPSAEQGHYGSAIEDETPPEGAFE